MGGRSRGTNVRLEGIEELQERLTRILRETEDLRPAWEDIYRPAVLDGQRRYFDSSGDNRWPDLTDRYLFYKARKGVGTRILVGTPPRRKFARQVGMLRASLTQRGHPNAIYDRTPRWMRMGTRDPVANIHFGRGRRQRKAIDAKAPSMRVAFQKAVQEHLDYYDDLWGGKR